MSSPLSTSVTGHPLPPPAPPRSATPRDGLLRLALFSSTLGAVLTTAYAWVLARQEAALPTPTSFSAYERAIVPLLALVAVGGALLLDRLPALGVILLIVGTGFGLDGGSIYLVPGALLGCAWAARHNHLARTVLGFLLLIPGSAAGYYGIMAGLSYLAGQSLPGLPPSLAPPASLAEALMPLEVVPLAFLGAWLLVAPMGKSAR